MDNLLISHACVLTMDPELGDLDDADVLVVGNRIVAVGRALPTPPGTDVVDGRGGVLLPGFVDTHRHMFQALVRGMAPAHSLTDYYEHVLGRVGTRLTPAELAVGETLSAQASLLSGITTVQDVSNIQTTPEHTDAIVGALRGSGLRAVFAYGKAIGDVLQGGSALPADEVGRVRRDLLARDDALVTMAVVTESGDDETERANARLARELGVHVVRHVSAQTPISRLAALDALVPGSTFVHGNGLAADELQVIADHDGNLSVSPAIELVMGHGYPALPDAPTGLRVTLSADVEVTVSGDPFTQMRAAYQAARARDLTLGGAERAWSVRDVLAAATREGAVGLGLGDRAGTITPGKQADLVLLRLDRPDVSPVVDPYSTVVLQADRAHVDTVVVAGRIKVRNGALCNAEDVSTDAVAVVARLRESGALAAR